MREWEPARVLANKFEYATMTAVISDRRDAPTTTAGQPSTAERPRLMGQSAALGFASSVPTQVTPKPPTLQ
jgi:hypothetical protein